MQSLGDRLVGWQGEVAIGALLRETLRTLNRRPVGHVAAPAAVLFGLGSGMAAVSSELAHQSLVVVAVGVLVAVWAWIAQGVAGVRKPRATFRLGLVALFVAASGIYLAQRFDVGWLPFTAVVLLPTALSLAIPGAAVDGLRAGVVLREVWNTGCWSRLRVAMASSLLMMAHLALLAVVVIIVVRVSTQPWLVVGVIGGVAGSALGSTMVSSSIAYVYFRERWRRTDVSAWVEAFE